LLFRLNWIFTIQIKDKLTEVAIYDFPTNSKGKNVACYQAEIYIFILIALADVPQGSIIHSEYITALNKLLRALVQTASVDILHVLFPVLREPNHIHEPGILQAIQAFVDRLSSDDKSARKAFTLCFEAFMVHACLDLVIQTTKLIHILSRMLRNKIICVISL